MASTYIARPAATCTPTPGLTGNRGDYMLDTVFNIGGERYVIDVYLGRCQKDQR